MDTLAFGYILPTTGRIWDLHPWETCAARRTNKKSEPFSYWKKVRILCLWCTSRDSNPGPTD